MLVRYGVNSGLTSAVLRRQQFLIRTLGGYTDQTSKRTMQQVKSRSGTGLEADSESILREITPILDPSRHKGQAESDLGDEERRHISSKILTEVDKWMERFDCIVVGPGLGRDPFLLDCVSKIMKLARQSNVPIVVDADGLFLVTNSLDLVSGYPLAVLTPNVNEFKRLFEKVLISEVGNRDAPELLQSLSKRLGGVTILQKGKSDLVSDGDTVKSVSIYGSPRRCGGQGDILSGRLHGTIQLHIHQMFVNVEPAQLQAEEKSITSSVKVIDTNDDPEAEEVREENIPTQKS